MKIGHIHIGFKNLESAVKWMSQKLGKEPGYSNPNMAAFYFDGINFVFDQSDTDSSVSLAITSESCDTDFESLTIRGAKTIEVPADQLWGVRTAYIEGPGKLIFELEETLK